jgi:hypothetical protein
MADHAATQHWYSRIEGREVAIFRGVVAALVAIALIWGVDLTELGSKLEQTADILGTVVFGLLGPLWIRGGVTPVKDPIV